MNDDNLLRREVVKCRITKEEKKQVQLLADKEAQENRSLYVRKCILKYGTLNPRVLQSLANLEFQLKKISNNIGQIVRAYHGDFFSKEDKRCLQNSLDRFENLFLKLSDEMR